MRTLAHSNARLLNDAGDFHGRGFLSLDGVKSRVVV